VFGSVQELTKALRLGAKHWNDDPRPFIWTKGAEEIIQKVRRGRAALHQINPATDHWAVFQPCEMTSPRCT